MKESAANEIVGVLETTLGGEDFLFVVERFTSFATTPLPLKYTFCGWNPVYVGTVGRLFLEQTNTVVGYRGQFVKMLFNIWPGLLFDLFRHTSIE